MAQSKKSATYSESQVRGVEAVLFLSREPISARKIAAQAGLPDPTAARSIIALLNAKYDDFGRAYRIEEVAGGLQLLTRQQFAPWLRRLDLVPQEQVLRHGRL